MAKTAHAATSVAVLVMRTFVVSFRATDCRRNQALRLPGIGAPDDLGEADQP
jgi:hypothetical protein